MSTAAAHLGSGTRVIVTGASGFIGAAVTQRLLQAGATVHALYRRTPPGVAAGAIWRQCDLEQEDTVLRTFDAVRPDVVIHLASHVSGGRDLALVGPTLRSNLLSTVNVLTAASRVGSRRVVLTGSMEEPVPASEWPVPCSPYAAAKFAASAYGRLFYQLYRTPVVMLRLFMVYGPGQRDRTKLVPYTVTSLLNGTAPRLSNGRRNIDWVYVDDVVEAYLRAGCADGIDGQTIDIASGTAVTVRSLVQRVVDLVNPAIRPQFGAVPERAAEQEPVANLVPAERLLQWRATTSLEDGLARTVDWYRRYVAASSVVAASVDQQ